MEAVTAAIAAAETVGVIDHAQAEAVAGGRLVLSTPISSNAEPKRSWKRARGSGVRRIRSPRFSRPRTADGERAPIRAV
jgi:hypothetical protein